jgi:DNA repair photolyase
MPEASDHGHPLVHGPVRGRGAGVNPGNRFESVRLHVLGEHLDEIVAQNPDGTQVRTLLYNDDTRTIINKVDSPDLDMKWTINPYRGCEHGCAYCYARPTHETLGFSCGLDFETRIVVKRDAAALLRKELLAPKWSGETIMMSGVTDPYQPIEAKLKITRACLEVMAEFGQSVALITKNRMITRDLDVLRPLIQKGRVGAAISITTLDKSLAVKMEPRASSPADRLRAVRELVDAGVPVTVMTAPIIPGLNDHEIPALLEAAKEAGASSAGYVLLRLPHGLKDVFLDWLARELPDRAAKVESQLREARGGALYNSKFRERQRGQGARAEQIGQTFRVFARRLGLDGRRPPMAGGLDRAPPPPAPNSQLPLFG